MILDEDSRCPPLVNSSIIFDATMRDYREILSAVDVPMLVCAGVDEKWRTVDVGERTAALVPVARFEPFEESGHCLTIAEPVLSPTPGADIGREEVIGLPVV